MLRKQTGPNMGSLGRIDVFGSGPKSLGMSSDLIAVGVADTIAPVSINHKNSEIFLVVTVT